MIRDRHTSCLYLHLETQKSGIDVDGWFPEKLAVSVAIALTDTSLRIFTEKNLAELGTLLRSAKRVVGYNLRDFDLRVLSGHPEVDLGKVKTLDLLADLEKATDSRVSLSSVVEATLGIVPSLNGLDTVKLWKAGHIEKVIEGCSSTALMIKAMHEYGRTHGHVFYTPQDAKRRKRIDVNWK